MSCNIYSSYRQGRREPNVGPGTAQTWIGTLKLEGPPLELKYDVMGPLILDGPPLELKYVVMGPGRNQVISKNKSEKKGLHQNFDCLSGRNQVISKNKSKKKGLHRYFDCFSGRNQVISFYYSM